MSVFTETLFATAARSSTGLTVGEPATPRRSTWAAIHMDACRVASGLKRNGVGRGDSVALLAGCPLSTATTVQAIWMRGGNVTMLQQPTPRIALADWVAHTAAVVRMLAPTLVLVGPPFEQAVAILHAHQIPATALDSMAGGTAIDPISTGDDDIALQQLTSGSTGTPKAVQVSHANLHANTAAMRRALAYAPGADVIVSWLPLAHDMGMVGLLLTPMRFGGDAVIATPQTFLRDPLVWADLISKHRGTITSAPNFAYAVLTRRLQHAPDGRCDLSSLRLALCGAEPVDTAVMRGFRETGSRYGLPAQSLTPAYGLAEATVAVSFSTPGRGLRVDRIDRRALESQFRAVPTSGPDAVELTTLGHFVPGLKGRFVRADGTICGVREVGSLHVRGPSVCTNYNTEHGPQRITDCDGWLDTGDLGYISDDGLVVICGREKEIIVQAGRNILPTDVERAAAAADGVRRGNAVAVRIDPGTPRECFAVVVESKKYADPVCVSAMRSQIEHRVLAAVGHRPATVRVVGPGTIPKTMSGKLRRSACRSLIVVPP